MKIYLYADEASQAVLLDAREKILLLGGDFGYGNFGDVLQHVNALRIVREAGRFATISVMAANAIGFADFPSSARRGYGTDAILFVSEYPLILDENSPRLALVGEIRNLAAVYLYGGGFLNSIWGDYILGVTEYFLNLAPDAAFLVSGQQITPPYQSRVIDHIKAFNPRLFGVRDGFSRQLLRDAGFDPKFSFDDATEALNALTKRVVLKPGPGLLMHLNSSDYTANTSFQRGIGDDVKRLYMSAWSREGVTLLQAFRDLRQDVHDSCETVKKLDAQFPFVDLRLIDLVGLLSDDKKTRTVEAVSGRIGYSCSYHVALWLQLAGVPCWLRSSNPFYDQKSRALLVSQDLESFLEEPHLADHRVNLEERAQWCVTFANELANIPEARNVSTISKNKNGPAPWPFFFKGTPTLEDKLSQAQIETQMFQERIEALTAQLTEVGNEAHKQRERAEAAETSLDQVRHENLTFSGRVEALIAQLTEVGNEAHKQRERAEVAEASLGSLGECLASVESALRQLLNSRSWRITRPLRAIVRRFRRQDSL